MTVNLDADTVHHLIVSTDLDGTLLDHHNYSWQPAARALKSLSAQGIPVIINTSKTFREVVNLQRELALDAPFVVENGSALFIPKTALNDIEGAESYLGYWQITLGENRSKVLEFLKQVRSSFKWSFEGFADWNVQGIMDKTGLSEGDAQLASERGFSEPIVWQDSEENFLLFKEQAEAAGLKLLQGGRFVHVLGSTDKGKALEWLSEYYLEHLETELKWIALGDSQNDVAMLSVADFPVLVKSPSAEFPVIENRDDVVYTNEYGPAGWQQAIFDLLKEFKL